MSLRRIAVAALIPWLSLWPALTATAATTVGVTPAPVPVSPASSYVPVGTPIEGGTTAASGPLISAPGQYHDVIARGSTSIGSDGEPKFYTVHLARGDKAFFSATLILPAGRTHDGSGQVDLTISDLDQTSGCSFDDHDDSFFSGETARPLAVAVRVPTVDGPAWPSECPNGTTFVVQVTRSGDAFAHRPADLELGFHLEPSADTAGLPGPAPSRGAVPVDIGTAVRSMHAGRSFDNAPELGPGRYQDSISAGQTRFVRVHLSWGQRLSFLISPGTVAAAGGNGVQSEALVFNPVRNVVRLSTDASASTYAFGGTSGALKGTTAYAVRYANRTVDSQSPDSAAVDSCMAGDYYLALSAGYPDKGTIRVPYTLALTVIGKPERGPVFHPLAGQSAKASASGPARAGVIVAAVGGAVLLAAALLLIVVIVRRRRAPTHAGPGYAITEPQRRR